MKVIGSDTILDVSAKTIRIYNHIEADLVDCTRFADSLDKEIDILKEVVADLKSKEKVNQQLVNNYEAWIEQLQLLKDSYQKESKRKAIGIKFLKGTATFAVIVAVLEAGWIWLTEVTRG